jgi:hypothetical protein
VVIRLVKIKIVAYKASAEPNVFQQEPENLGKSWRATKTMRRAAERLDG